MLGNSVETEKTVLGCVMLREEVIFQALPVLAPEDFHISSHQKIYRAMVALANVGKPIDYTSLMNQLGKEFESVGGNQYLSDLADGTVRRSNIEHHVNIVKSNSQRRQLYRLLDSSIKRLEDEELPGVAEDVTRGMYEILSASGQQAAPAVECVDAVFHQAIEQMNSSLPPGLPTGIDSLDSLIGGYRKGELVVIGGRPGQGKSALAVQGMAACARAGYPAQAFSLEMTKEEIVKRIISQHTKTEFYRLHNPKYLNPQSFQVAVDSAQPIKQWPLWVDDSAGLDINELAARTRLAARRNGVQIVFVDYVQLVRAKGLEERQRVSLVSETLRQLAKTENIAVVSLSQLARPKDGEENERPTMYRLMESGKLEQDAHTVLLLYRPVRKSDDLEGRRGDFTGEDEIIVAKQRHGRTGHKRVWFDGATMEFKGRE